MVTQPEPPKAVKDENRRSEGPSARSWDLEGQKTSERGQKLSSKMLQQLRAAHTKHATKTIHATNKLSFGMV